MLQKGKDVAGFTEVAEIVEAAECCGRPLKIYQKAAEASEEAEDPNGAEAAESTG